MTAQAPPPQSDELLLDTWGSSPRTGTDPYTAEHTKSVGAPVKNLMLEREGARRRCHLAAGRRIALAVDHDACAERAAHYASKLIVKSEHDAVEVVHVKVANGKECGGSSSGQGSGGGKGEGCQQLLERVCQLLLRGGRVPQGQLTTTLLRQGHKGSGVGPLLEQHCRERGIEILLLGCRRQTGIGKLFGLRRRTSVGKYLHEQLPGVTIVVISPPDFSGC